MAAGRENAKPADCRYVPDMLADPAQLIDAVRAKFGPRAAIDDAADVEPWLTDWRGRFHGRAAGILAPASTA